MGRLWIGVVVAAGLAAQQPAATAPEGSGSLEGRVVNQATGEPIRKANVRMGGQASQLVAVTDSGGRFAFRRLPAGMYWLSADHEEFSAPDLMRGAPPQPITLGAGEQKTDLELRLIPQARLSGRVLDEDGAAVSGCGVSVMQHDYQQGRRWLAGRGGDSTNDKGEYRVRGLRPGRYYVFLHCSQELPAPHPLMPRGDPRIPQQVYAAQYYPGVPELTGATKLAVPAGGDVRAIDFQVRRIGAVKVQGHVTAPEGLGRMPVVLMARSSAAGDTRDVGGGSTDETGHFTISGVPPGSYILAAGSYGEGQGGWGSLPLEVGSTPPDPVELVLSPGVEISGTVEMPRDSAEPESPKPAGPRPAGPRVMLTPVEQMPLPPRVAEASVAEDGTFTLAGVMPGRWRLMLLNAAGYIQSLLIGGQEVSPYSFNVGAGAAAPWRIVIGNQYGEVAASITDTLPAGQGGVSILFMPENPAAAGSGMEGETGPDAQGHATLRLRPGRYRAYALESRAPWMYMQWSELLEALASRSEAVNVEAGQQTSVSLGLVRAGELQQLLETLE